MGTSTVQRASQVGHNDCSQVVALAGDPCTRRDTFPDVELYATQRSIHGGGHATRIVRGVAQYVGEVLPCFKPEDGRYAKGKDCIVLFHNSLPLVAKVYISLSEQSRIDLERKNGSEEYLAALHYVGSQGVDDFDSPNSSRYPYSQSTLTTLNEYGAISRSQTARQLLNAEGLKLPYLHGFKTFQMCDGAIDLHVAIQQRITGQFDPSFCVANFMPPRLSKDLPIFVDCGSHQNFIRTQEGDVFYVDLALFKDRAFCEKVDQFRQSVLRETHELQLFLTDAQLAELIDPNSPLSGAFCRNSS